MSKLSSYISNTINGITPVRFFIITASVFGLLFLLITPPFQTPDEPVHFFRAYEISQLNFVVDSNKGVVGGYLPKAVGDTVTETSTNPIIKFLPNRKYSVRKTINALSLKVNQQNQRFYDFSGTALYSPISYAPQVTGIWVARLFRAPPIVMVYVAKLFNLIAWIGICALAIKLIPKKKWAIVFLALLPMSLFEAASLSTDVMATGSVIIFFAYILKLIESNEVLTKKQMIYLLAVATIMVLSKQAMFVFLPLVFLIPNRLFKKMNTAYFMKTTLTLLPIITWLIWFNITRKINLNSSYVNGQAPSSQLKFIVIHPYSYINVLWNTYFFTWGDTITRSFIGSFGWVDTPLSEGIVTIGYVGLALVLLLNTTKIKARKWLTKRQKMLVALVALVYFLAVSTALYLYFTPVGFKIIVGLQGRYMLPTAILLVPVFYCSWLRASRLAYRRIAILTPIFLLVASVITIYIRYYVNNV